MRFVCDSCRAQYMISDEKVGAKGVKVRCKKCGFVILVRRADAGGVSKAEAPPEGPTNADDSGGGQDEAPKNGNIFGGVGDDELGAVFDQALGAPGGGSSSGSTNDLINQTLGSAKNDLDETDSTRVMDAAAMKKLAQSSQDEASDPNGKAPAQDWFVAIDEKQSGPFGVDRIKELWNRGEIGPDSLAWRAGLADWQPVSEIQELASALAPRPQKPVIVAPVAVTPAAAVVNVQVESAFNAGGVNKTVRTDVPMVAAAAASLPEAGGTWRPTAGRALAALVKDEIDALAKPTQVKADAAEALPVRGLWNLPSAEAAAQQNARATGQRQRAAEAAASDAAPARPAESYVAPAPAYSAYVPPAQKRNLTWVFVGLAAVLVFVMSGTLVYLVASRSPQPPTQVVYQMQPPPQQPAVAARAPAQAPAVAGAATPNPAVAVAPAQPTVANPNQIAAPNADAIKGFGHGGRHGGGARSARSNVGADGQPVAAAPAVDKGAGEIGDSAGGDKAFEDAFGGGSKTSESVKKQSKSVYVPPAPGGANLPEALEQSDIMTVVLQNKPSIVNCVNEQKKRVPGSAGKLSMRWTVQTNGRVGSVAVAENSADQKGTYMATCMTSLIKGWVFPKHQKQGDAIVFPFTY